MINQNLKLMPSFTFSIVDVDTLIFAVNSDAKYLSLSEPRFPNHIMRT